MATRGQEVWIAVLIPATLLSVGLMVYVAVWKYNNRPELEYREMKQRMAELDKKVKELRVNEEKKKKKEAEEPKPPREVPPLEWAVWKIEGLEGEDIEKFIHAVLVTFNGGTPGEKFKAALKASALKPAAAARLATLGLGHRSDDVRYYTVRAFGMIDEGDLPLEQMKERVQDIDPLVRVALARTVGLRAEALRGDREADQAFALVRELLRDPDPRVAYAAVSAMGRLRDGRFGPLLVEALARSTLSRDEQHHICRALETIFGYEVGIEYLPAPVSPKQHKARVDRWLRWGEKFGAPKESATATEGPAADASNSG